MAFAVRQRFTLLFNTTGPVSQMPSGTSTTPPPFLLQAPMASLMLFEFRVIPSATAPNFRMLKVSFLNTGCCTTGKAFCACSIVQETASSATEHIFETLFIVYFLLPQVFYVNRIHISIYIILTSHPPNKSIIGCSAAGMDRPGW